jgi:chromosome segregation ATPase
MVEQTIASAPQAIAVNATQANPSIDLPISPKGDMPSESRIFYRWLDEQWHKAGESEEQAPPTRYLLEELDTRGRRIRAIADEYDELRQRLGDYEAQTARFEHAVSERDRLIAALNRDLDEIEERYRKALQIVMSHREARAEAEGENAKLRAENESMRSLLETALPLEESIRIREEYHAMRSRAEQSEMKLNVIEQTRKDEGDRYREIFAEKDSHVRRFQKLVAEREARIQQLEAQMAGSKRKGFFGR